MPIFEYQCLKCGHKFEILVLGKEKLACPRCKSSKLKKLISSCNIKKSCPTCNISCPTCKE